MQSSCPPRSWTRPPNQCEILLRSSFLSRSAWGLSESPSPQSPRPAPPTWMQSRPRQTRSARPQPRRSCSGSTTRRRSSPTSCRHIPSGSNLLKSERLLFLIQPMALQPLLSAISSTKVTCGSHPTRQACTGQAAMTTTAVPTFGVKGLGCTRMDMTRAVRLVTVSCPRSAFRTNTSPKESLDPA